MSPLGRTNSKLWNSSSLRACATSSVGPEPSADAEAAGGYARAQTEEEQRKTMDAMATHLKDQDLVVTTAQIPGRAAPRLITAAMVASMKPGAVIVDLAAETGGNCELTTVGETTVHHGVSVIGAVNLPSSVPHHASLMFSKNVLTLLQHFIKDGSITLNLASRDGRALLQRLVPSAHFLIESFPPGDMEQLGLGYTALAALNPALILVSVTPFGQDGPYAHYRASDLNGMGMAGFMYLTGDPDRPPQSVGDTPQVG